MPSCFRVASSARPAVLAAVLAAILMPVLAGPAVAQTVPTDTGCLKVATGTLSKIKAGLQPLAPCAADEATVRLSSGDIIGLVTPAAGGLQGGTLSGTALLQIQPSFRLPQACGSGQVPRWTGSAWECSTPASGGGALTRLEDLNGLPCGAGAGAGTTAVAINPLSGTVGLACPPLGQFMLNVAVGGPGSVASLTPDITCGLGGGDCAHAYRAGEVVTLAASTEADAAVFSGWGGACTGTDPHCQVTMNQARQVTATFLPTATVNLITFASARNFGCAFNICVYSDNFAEAKGRVTVTDLDTGLIAGTCDSDTTIVVASSQFAPPAMHTTTCNVPVVTGHHLRFTAEDMTTLGGVKTFQNWNAGPCTGSSNRVCTPADPVSAHDITTAVYN